METPLIF